QHFKKSILEVVPTRARPVMYRFLQESSNQVGSYVRGVILIAISVAIMFHIDYLIISLDYTLILSITAGLLNLIPYLGSIMASIPVLNLGACVSPLQLVKVIIVIIIEQTLDGRVISPQILGNKLEIHPLVIL